MKQSRVLIAIIIILAISAAVVWSSGVFDQGEKSPITFERAKVTRIISQELTIDTAISKQYIGEQLIEIELLTGELKGERYEVKNFLGRLYNVHAKEDMELVMLIEVEDGTMKNIGVYNYSRANTIYILTALFLIILALVGGIKGIKSIISLIFTAVLVIFLLIPLIYKGYSPVLVAIGVAVLTVTVSMYLISGWNKKTLAAVLGIVIGVIISGVISYIAGGITHLSGLTMEQADELLQIANQTKMNVRGLMFASILIGALGAIMDTGMSIASALFEIHSINPQLGKKELFKSAMNVGRDMIGTMVNTLILAFAGGALNTMLIILSYKMPYIQVINLDLIATELVQSIAGSIGIILTVPITAFSCVMLINYKGQNKKADY